MKANRLLPLLFMGCLSGFAENRLLPLAPPAGYTSLTFQDLSADGRTALGMASGGSSNRVCTWSADTTGFSIIRGIADTEIHGATALSGDGSTVLGYSPDPANANNSRPWIYRGGSLSQLTVPGSYEKPGARELSYDGGVVVGQVDVNLAANTFAFRPAYWTTPPGGSPTFTLLSSKTEFQVQGWLDATDAAGRYLFGDYLVYAAPASYDHYRYDRLNGSLVLLANVHNVSLEEASADGSLMVYKTYQNRMAQWNSDQTTQEFEYTPGVGFTGYRYVYGGMTADGARVFGTEERFNAFGGGTSGSRLVFWDADRNLHDFTELFDGTSVDTNGWNFGLVGGRIYGVSTNGLRLIGRAHYNGQLTAFYLEIEPGAPPAFSIQNVAVAQREGSKLVDIYYDLSNAVLNAAEISVAIRDGGTPVVATNLTGDVGALVVTGAMKHIVWDAGADWNGNISELQYSVYATGEATNAFTTASTDTRNYVLNVNSAFGSPVPAVGSHSNWCWKSTVTASVDSAVMVGGTNYSCSGWGGTGTIPTLGSGTNIVFTLVEPVTTVNWNWIEDQDLDRIPGCWELFYYGSETGAVASADTDGDGYTAWQEYILGSNPTNSGSSFLFTPSPAQPTNSAFSIDFTTVTGRLYTVECTDDLASGNWQVLTNFIGDGSAAQLIDPASIPNCFYHVRIDWTP